MLPGVGSASAYTLKIHAGRQSMKKNPDEIWPPSAGPIAPGFFFTSTEQYTTSQKRNVRENASVLRGSSCIF